MDGAIEANKGIDTDGDDNEEEKEENENDRNAEWVDETWEFAGAVLEGFHEGDGTVNLVRERGLKVIDVRVVHVLVGKLDAHLGLFTHPLDRDLLLFFVVVLEGVCDIQTV